jgi:hypothetical protein
MMGYSPASFDDLFSDDDLLSEGRWPRVVPWLPRAVRMRNGGHAGMIADPGGD